MGDQIDTASRHLHTLTGMENQKYKNGSREKKSLNQDPSLPSCWLGYKLNLKYVRKKIFVQRHFQILA